MLAYVYGAPREIDGFEDYLRPRRTAVLSLGMTRVHACLASTVWGRSTVRTWTTGIDSARAWP